jgi:N-acetylglucosamine-6-phosphate deacetylase
MIPGFVDIQVNGYGGVDFSDPRLTESDIDNSVRMLTSAGTSAFLPTIVTSSAETYRTILPLWARVIRSRRHEGVLLGLHLEGPFISRAAGAVGAHTRRFVRAPDIAYLDTLLALAEDTTLMITVAAGVPGIEELIRHARKRGVVVFLGHHLALSAELHSAMHAGATGLTHLGNAVPARLERHPNPVIDGLAAEALAASFISDGHHIPESVIHLLMKTRTPDKLAVISDSSPIAGLPPGEYRVMRNRAVLEPSGRLYNARKQCLVGSSCAMLQCMNVLFSLGVRDEKTLSALGYQTPLSLIGLPADCVRPTPRIAFSSDSGFRALDPEPVPLP